MHGSLLEKKSDGTPNSPSLFDKYEGEKMGVKLGARRYYDAFQKQWKMEPILTPPMKIGKKMYFELPVGPLVQRSMEKLLKRQTNNSPVITPNLK